MTVCSAPSPKPSLPNVPILTTPKKYLIDIHAFLAWFDIIFECAHRPVKFSTGPHAKYTHWKYVRDPDRHHQTNPSESQLIRQTVFYTPHTLTVNKGDRVHGSLRCAPNARNPRDLDIGIRYRVNDDNDDEETRIQYKMCVTIVFSLFYLSSPLYSGHISE